MLEQDVTELSLSLCFYYRHNMFKEIENKILLHFFERPVDCFSGEAECLMSLIKHLYEDLPGNFQTRPTCIQIAFSLAPPTLSKSSSQKPKIKN